MNKVGMTKYFFFTFARQIFSLHPLLLAFSVNLVNFLGFPVPDFWTLLFFENVGLENSAFIEFQSPRSNFQNPGSSKTCKEKGF